MSDLSLLSAAGGPEVLSITKVADVPKVADGEVLIKVAAAGVNRPDVIQRQGIGDLQIAEILTGDDSASTPTGLYPAPKFHSQLPGLEVAGTIVHSNSSAWKEGDQVCALANGGGYAEFWYTRGFYFFQLRCF